MPSPSRNMPEQEHSIKARSHELFVEPGQLDGKATKPFPVYLSETPAQPFSPLTKAIFWILGILVIGLFLAAVWRISHRHKTKRPDRQPPAKTVMVHPRDELHRQRLASTRDAVALVLIVIV